MNSAVGAGVNMSFNVYYDSSINSINVSCSGNQTSFEFFTEE